jgi:GDPmannose 4,6-dehydratase
MLQQDRPDDCILATGETHTVERFMEIAFETIGLRWEAETKFEQFVEIMVKPELQNLVE